IGTAARIEAGIKIHTIYMNRFITHSVVPGKFESVPRGGSRARVGGEDYHGSVFVRKLVCAWTVGRGDAESRRGRSHSVPSLSSRSFPLLDFSASSSGRLSFELRRFSVLGSRWSVPSALGEPRTANR